MRAGVMAVSYYIPAFLRTFTEGQSRVELDASPATVGEALDALCRGYPGIRDRVLTEQGQVRQHVNVFVGDESIRYTGGLETPAPEGVEIAIVPAVSGGSRAPDRSRTGA
jgi:molybdopterin converting factor small subunit